jgi:carbamoyltransferase
MGITLGLSCHYHDSAAAVVADGVVKAAAQEERYNRDKYSQVFPIQAINDCMQLAGASLMDIDRVAFYEKPFLKLARTLVGHLESWPRSRANFMEMMPSWLDDRLTLPLDLRRELGYQGSVLFIKHHLSHASSSFLVSPFEEAALLTVDGIGEWASSTWGVGRGSRIAIKKELRYPNSVGLLYAIISTYLGFRVFTGEGKVMALAAYGEPTLVDRFRQCVDVRPDGSCRLDPGYFAFNRGDKMYTPRLVELLGPEAVPGQPHASHHLDVAASLQALVEEILLKMARHVQKETGLRKACLAGGVFLNVVANSRILRETPFDDLFIQPAAGDAGAALGAALYVHHVLDGHPRGEPMEHAYLGSGYEDRQLVRAARARGLSFEQVDDEAELAQRVAARIADGAIVAFFQDRMEYGPRALGARSILADCRDPEMKDTLNRRVKHREDFRPYGVAVLDEELSTWFDLERASPYMLLVGNILEHQAQRVPSAVHVDGTCRIQSVKPGANPRYRAVIEAFHALTGVPMIINTSFNVQEPIVRTPDEAIATFERSDMDLLVLGNLLLEKGG